MQTILESFVEIYGSYDMVEDKNNWRKLFEVFTEGWKAKKLWNDQVAEKYKDFPYAETLHGEKSEEDA